MSGCAGAEGWILDVVGGGYRRFEADRPRCDVPGADDEVRFRQGQTGGCLVSGETARERCGCVENRRGNCVVRQGDYFGVRPKPPAVIRPLVRGVEVVAVRLGMLCMCTEPGRGIEGLRTPVPEKCGTVTSTPRGHAQREGFCEPIIRRRKSGWGLAGRPRPGGLPIAIDLGIWWRRDNLGVAAVRPVHRGRPGHRDLPSGLSQELGDSSFEMDWHFGS